MEDKNRKKEQGQRIENSNKHDKYSSSYVNNNFLNISGLKTQEGLNTFLSLVDLLRVQNVREIC